MMEYALYLESGPRRRKTMVHVLDLLGCIAQGPTTEAALEATPQAIRTYLRFLERHGEAIHPEADFSIRITVHVMEGGWIGNGDPPQGFEPDFKPLTAADLKTHLRRLGWLQADLLELIQDVPRRKMEEEPRSGGRSIQDILKHVANTHGVYLRYLTGQVEGLSAALKAVKQTPVEALPAALSEVWQISRTRLEILTEAERRQFVPHGEVTWTARRALRRMLEHGWEHFLEISRRFAANGPYERM